MVYNDGYSSLNKLFSTFFGSMGLHTVECFDKLDRTRRHTAFKEKNRRRSLAQTSGAAAAASPTDSDDDNVLCMINNMHLDDNSDNDSQVNELPESEEDESDGDDAYEAGGDD